MFRLTQTFGCKVNLGLQILRKREDGYHDIRTVFYPTDCFTDRVTVESSPNNLEFECNSAVDLGPQEQNLCVKAFKMLQEDFGIKGVKITLEKHIPIGAGLGGGSADAAAVLKLLTRAFRLPIDHERLKQYAAGLGSDVAFFIDGKPALASGRGEILEPVDLNLSGYKFRILKPAFDISTREAYANAKPAIPATDLRQIIARPLPQWKEALHNDFEDSVFPRHPALPELKTQLYNEGAVYASMTGSGSAMFGIFKAYTEKLHQQQTFRTVKASSSTVSTR